MMAKKSASTTPKSFTEIPKQETRKPTSQTVAFDPDVLDFLTFCQTNIGDLNYCVNNIIRTYRDNLPVDRRGPQPEVVEIKPKASTKKHTPQAQNTESPSDEKQAAAS
jgi:hypothetical protein